jgi:DNA helicase MCM9
MEEFEDQEGVSLDQELVAYLLNYKRIDVLEVLRKPDQTKHYAIYVSIAHVASVNIKLADLIISNPTALLNTNVSTVNQNQLLSSLPPTTGSSSSPLTIKPNAHLRFIAPSTPSTEFPTSNFLNHLTSLSGTIVRTGPIKMLEARRYYQCPRCSHQFVVAVDLESGGHIQLPKICPSGRDKPCTSSSFVHCKDIALYTNFQEVRVQEKSQVIGGGAAPRCIAVLLQDEMADSVIVGEDIEVSGVVIKQWQGVNLFPGARCAVGLAVRALGLSVAKDRRNSTIVDVPPSSRHAFQAFWQTHDASNSSLVGRNKLVASVCPQLHGLFGAKLAALLCLLGGPSGKDREGDGFGGGGLVGPRSNDNNALENYNTAKNIAPGEAREAEAEEEEAPGGSGEGSRGSVHFLLVGDPGTGKSQLQSYVAKLAPRAVMASGNSTSAAGLTAAAIREGGQWSLEAGALVLADGGVCLIDEFDGVKEVDRAAIHEAMEQQTVSVAKAGMTTTLQARTTIFAACNPKHNQRFNPQKPLAHQLAVSGPLLSRFDIVMVLPDPCNPEVDNKVADHILATHQIMNNNSNNCGGNGGGGNRGDNGGGDQYVSPQIVVGHTQMPTSNAPTWSIEHLRQYIYYSKQTFQPALSPAAERVLHGYYAARRAAAGRQGSRTTVRMLESLIRLTQAHARLMHRGERGGGRGRGEAQLQDAVMAVVITEATSSDGGDMLQGPLLISHMATSRGLIGGTAGKVSVTAISNALDRFKATGEFPEDPESEYAVLEEAVLSLVGGGGEGGGRGCRDQQHLLMSL